MEVRRYVFNILCLLHFVIFHILFYFIWFICYFLYKVSCVKLIVYYNYIHSYFFPIILFIWAVVSLKSLLAPHPPQKSQGEMGIAVFLMDMFMFTRYLISYRNRIYALQYCTMFAFVYIPSPVISSSIFPQFISCAMQASTFSCLLGALCYIFFF